MTDDILALTKRLNEFWLPPSVVPNEAGMALMREAAEALSRLTVSPLPSPGEAAAEAVCHDEQLEIWTDEFVEHLLAIGFAPDFETYGQKIKYFSAVKDAIKDLVGKAFDHPELEKTAVSVLPEEIADHLHFLRTYSTHPGITAAAAALERMARENADLSQTAARAADAALARIRDLEAERADAIRAKTIQEVLDAIDGLHTTQQIYAAIRALRSTTRKA